MFRITGGNPLNGTVRVQGAKNAALPVLAATLLCEGESVITNCPDLLDIASSRRILRHLGCKADWVGAGTVTVDASVMTRTDIPDALMREMRSSVVYLGAILSRAGNAVMSYPGGCDLGPRPIDMHLDALKQMGAEIREEGGYLYCSAPVLAGCDIHLPMPSVGATENILLAAAKARGVTRIFNAACEPEIEDLQKFINVMGGRVRGAGTPFIVIEGVERLSGAEHRVLPDRIVAATLLAAAASTGGDILLTDLRPEDTAPVAAVLGEAGCAITYEGSDRLRIRHSGRLKAMGRIRTMPHPGFPTDAQAVVMAAACIAGGTTVFSETVFENRYRHAAELLRMGADIQVEGRAAVVCGVRELSGARVDATDLRGGAALVVAALAAEGDTFVGEVRHIDRGYEKLEDTLASLGADIRRISHAGEKQA